MADQSKLEQMLEKLVNNDRDGADSLFHEFVIEKSRGIYEKMLEDDLKDLEVDEGSHDKDKKDEKKKKDDKDMKEESDESEESVEEASNEDEEVDEASDEETDENMEITPEADPMGGDAADDMIDDMKADDEEGDMEKGDDDEEIEDRVVDLEDALDDLKAEFEKMMADKGGDDMDDMDDDAADMDMGDEEKEDEAVMPTSELGGEELPVEDMEPSFEGKKSEGEVMREYVNKVATPKGEDNKAKSPVASANNMGGTASNIAQGGEGATGGSAMSSKEDDAGNVNKPGNAKAPAMNKANGHGAEKKGAGESGADAKSPIGS